MNNLKALFIREKVYMFKDFLEKHEINFQEWENIDNDEFEIRICLESLNDEKLNLLFNYLGKEYIKNKKHIVKEYDYLIFWQ